MYRPCFDINVSKTSTLPPAHSLLEACSGSHPKTVSKTSGDFQGKIQPHGPLASGPGSPREAPPPRCKPKCPGDTENLKKTVSRAVFKRRFRESARQNPVQPTGVPSRVPITSWTKFSSGQGRSHLRGDPVLDVPSYPRFPFHKITPKSLFSAIIINTYPGYTCMIH